MSPEKSLKDTGGQKQKVMIAIVVIVVLVIIWQVMGLKSGGGNTAPSITATPGAPNNGAPGGNQMMRASAGGSPPTAGTAMGQMAPSSSPTPMMQQPEISQPRSAPVQTNNELLKLQQQTQADYIASINKLQMLKIQREIDETKTAIATAELNRMTAEKSIADLITSKENLMGGNMDMPPTVNTTSTTTTTAPAAPVMPPIMMSSQPQLIAYTLLSVSFEGDKWTAILSNGGKASSVTVGEVLEDGSTVVSINRNTVVLKRETKVRTLTMPASL